MKNKKYILGCSILFAVFLGACDKSPEQIQAEKFKNDTKTAIQTYNEYLNTPIVGEEKSPEQIVEDLVKTDLGLNSNNTAYNLVGIGSDISLTVEKVILSNKDIPTIPNLTAEDIKTLNNTRDEETSNYTASEEYIKKQEKVLSRLSEGVSEDVAKTEEERLKNYFTDMYKDMKSKAGKELTTPNEELQKAEEEKKKKAQETLEEVEKKNKKEKSEEKEQENSEENKGNQ